MIVDNKWALFGGMILLTLIGFIAVNVLWFDPHFTVQIAPAPVFNSPADNPNIELINPFDETLKAIKSASKSGNSYSEQEGANISDPTGTKRNPFLWDGELTPPPPEKRAQKVQPVEIPRLGMIITGENNKTAMLDNTLVHPGDSYGGHVVENISPEFVILSGDYGVLKISISQTSFGAPTVDILEEKNPNLLIEPVFADKRRRVTRR